MILHKCITLITKTNLKVIQTLPKQILAHEPLPVNYSLYIPSFQNQGNMNCRINH